MISKKLKKELKEGKIWIDGFHNALRTSERIGAFAKWKPISKAPKNGTMLFLISYNDGMKWVNIGYWSNELNDWAYAPNDTTYYEPTHFDLIEYPKNTPVTKLYKTYSK
jgi:hypothetical protein